MADQTLDVAVGVERLGRVRRTGEIGVDLHFVDRRALVAELDFTADEAEIIAGDEVNIETKVVVDGDGVVDVVGEIDVVVVVDSRGSYPRPA